MFIKIVKTVITVLLFFFSLFITYNYAQQKTIIIKSPNGKIRTILSR